MKKDFKKIYDQLNYLELIPELDPKNIGGYWRMKCPNCGHHEAYIYDNNPKGIKCNRENNCGVYTTLWDYIQQREGLDGRETYRFLAKNAGVPVRELTPEEIERHNKIQQKQKRLSIIWDFFRESLPGSDTEAYLKNRGIPEGLLTSFGYYPGLSETIKAMEGKGIQSHEVHQTLEFLKDRDGYGLVFPFYANTDMITIFGRYLGNDPEKQSKKYMPFGEYKRDIFFNTQSLNNPDRVLIVEGYMDALLLTHYGIPAVAIGSNTPGEKQLKDLMEDGIHDFIISLDNDPAGTKGKETAIYKIRKLKGRAYVLDTPEGKDPEEYIQLNGIDAFKELYKYPKKDYQYTLERLTQNYDDMGTVDQEITFSRHITHVGTLLEDPTEIDDFNFLVGEITGKTPEAIGEVMEKVRKTERQKKLVEDGIQLTEKARDLFNRGQTSKALELLNERSETLKGEDLERIPDPFFSLERLRRELNQVSEGIQTGYNELDNALILPSEGVSIIAGPSSHGKTTFMLNILRNLLEAPEHKGNTFLYFSFEETEKQIYVKLINSHAHAKISETNNNADLTKYIKGERIIPEKTVKEAVDRSAQTIMDLSYNQKRFGIFDMTGKDISQLESYLFYFQQRHHVAGVIVDYIQKIPIRGKYSTRQIELQKISHRILELAKKAHIPILLGSQFNKEAKDVESMDLNNVREAADIGNDAHVVLGIWNQHKGETKTEELKNIPEKINFQVKVLKNRNGPANFTTTLDLYPHFFRITGRKKNNFY